MFEVLQESNWMSYKVPTEADRDTSSPAASDGFLTATSSLDSSADDSADEPASASPAASPAASAHRPPWAMAGFPADFAELLDACGLQHLGTCFDGASFTVVSLACDIVAVGPAGISRRLADLGVTKVGERGIA